MTHRIAVLPGDGIGPEVMAAAIEVLDRIGSFDFAEYPIGAAAIRADGVPLPDRTLAACTSADAILLGAVGTGLTESGDGPRPEQGVLTLRAALHLYANLRPARFYPAMSDASPLKPSRLADADLVIVRELTGGLYFGQRGRSGEGALSQAFDTCSYSATEIERVARVAFALARSRASETGRTPRVTSVDKANVLATSALWREVVQGIAERDYPEVVLDHMLVDAAAMHLATNPARFDVILTENMFGDILSDETAALTGSLALLPSASLSALGTGEVAPGVFEPVHGSAPDIAGSGIANPLGMILSAALMLRYGLGLMEEANALENAVNRALERGFRTPDLGGDASTADAVSAVAAAL
jgi:3-isopropylmalate dehydrogenase